MMPCVWEAMKRGQSKTSPCECGSSCRNIFKIHHTMKEDPLNSALGHVRQLVQTLPWCRVTKSPPRAQSKLRLGSQVSKVHHEGALKILPRTCGNTFQSSPYVGKAMKWHLKSALSLGSGLQTLPQPCGRPSKVCPRSSNVEEVYQKSAIGVQTKISPWLGEASKSAIHYEGGAFKTLPSKQVVSFLNSALC